MNASDYLKRSTGRQPSWAIRLTDVRCFAQHVAHLDPMTEVPPTRLQFERRIIELLERSPHLRLRWTHSWKSVAF